MMMVVAPIPFGGFRQLTEHPRPTVTGKHLSGPGPNEIGDDDNELKVCGGFAGVACSPVEFCKLNMGECCCDFQGVCKPIPGGCPDVWEPVCGCDGQTYGNECDANALGISVNHLGPCMEYCQVANNGFGCANSICSNTGDQCIGTTLHFNDQSGAITTLVCACLSTDECHVEFGNVTPFPVGSCPSNDTACRVIGSDADLDGDDDIFTAACVRLCSGDSNTACASGEFCKFGPGDCHAAQPGYCTNVPSGCPNVSNPVCGCDGVTYGSACLADAARVVIAYSGACTP